MRQILWFRRDLRIEDNAILAHAKDEVLPLFIFDKNILDPLEKDDKRVNFIYDSVLKLKEKLKTLGLDLAIIYGYPEEIFHSLSNLGFDEILCSVDYDNYAINRDKKIEKILPLKRFLDSFILDPKDQLKADGTPYKVFTPFYKSLRTLTTASNIEEYTANKQLKKIDFNYEKIPNLQMMGFVKNEYDTILKNTPKKMLDSFANKITKYNECRDFFAQDGTSNFATFLRFGLLSPKQIFNRFTSNPEGEPFIRQLFWREFYNVILYHFPQSQNENFNGLDVQWEKNDENLLAWKEGRTGVPIVDAAMRHLNNTGFMHNRLRMIVASFLTKNLLIDWREGERYFAAKLMDYEASSNIGSWQWAASTGADATPYFRIFNPFTQSAKFDKEAKFITTVIPELASLPAKVIHESGGAQQTLVPYPKLITDMQSSRHKAIERFKKASRAYA